MFREVYSKIGNGSVSWQKLVAPDGILYPWDENSTYIKKPPFFDGMTKVKAPYSDSLSCEFRTQNLDSNRCIVGLGGIPSTK